MAQQKGLGKGLSALFGENIEVKAKPMAEMVEIALSDIIPNPTQPRTEFDEEALEELADSIRQLGLIQPITVKREGEKYIIISGERRWRASEKAGLKRIPAYIREVDDTTLHAMALVENIQREDLNPIEEAMAYRALADEYGMTQEEISQKIGKSRSAIANFERLLDLPDEILALVAAKELSAGHARTLLSLRDGDDMIAAAHKTIAEGWSVRTLEEECKRIIRRKKAAEKQVNDDMAEKPFEVDHAEVLTTRLMRELGRRVLLQDGKRKKTITFFYEDNEDLDRFLRRLCGDAFMDEE